MLLTILKWFVLPLAIILIILTLTGKKTFHIEVSVPAPPEQVWAVLMDTSSYPEWNPVFIKVDGQYQAGKTVKSTVRPPTGKDLHIDAKVLTVSPNRELRQFGGMTGLLTFDHQWLLESTDEGTKVIQHEVDKGLFMWFWDSSWIEPSYTDVSEALKQRVIDSL